MNKLDVIYSDENQTDWTASLETNKNVDWVFIRGGHIWKIVGIGCGYSWGHGICVHGDIKSCNFYHNP